FSRCARGHLGRRCFPTRRSSDLLLVWGSKDRMIPAWHALKAKETVPGIRVELFEGAGHFPHLDDPERFADLLRDFIATAAAHPRSEEHTSELQSRFDLVCRLLLE